MMNLPKVLSIILAAALILNFIGLAFRIIKPAAFWVVTIIAAITAYKIIPKLAKKK